MRTKKQKKGQVTIEYLFVLAVGISIVVVSFSTLGSIMYAFNKASTSMKVSSDIIRVVNAAKEVCILGKGNSRKIELSSEVNIICRTKNNKGIITFGYKEGETSRWLPCNCKSNVRGEKNVIIKWDDTLDRIAILGSNKG